MKRSSSLVPKVASDIKERDFMSATYDKKMVGGLSFKVLLSLYLVSF